MSSHAPVMQLPNGLDPAQFLRGAKPAVRNPNAIVRAAFTIADTRDDEARTIDATIATQNPVMVYDWGQKRIIQEVLMVRGAELPPWTPLLDSHMSYELRTPGSCINYRLEGDTIRATLRFAQDADLDPIWARYRDDHLRGVSVGGVRAEYTDIEPGQSAQVAGRRWTAGSKYVMRITTKWRIRETSLVVFGADG